MEINMDLNIKIVVQSLLKRNMSFKMQIIRPKFENVRGGTIRHKFDKF